MKDRLDTWRWDAVDWFIELLCRISGVLLWPFSERLEPLISNGRLPGLSDEDRDVASAHFPAARTVAQPWRAID
jgi:hypothetical protein